ncbi:MAG: PIN domain-containing protein [Huintestinicola sp.]|uniref:PIN domain-containing protein n=1 Tax=Huintestinicola sp. TaxID=2981661 RepID=UPI003F0C7C36
MSVFLVDFENVTSAGLAGIEKLTESDTVYIFYTLSAASLSFDAHRNVMSSKAKVNYISVTAGAKNALDFQLDSFLGYLAAVSRDRKFFIVSADNGYLAVKSFWEKTMGISDLEIKLIPNIRHVFRQTLVDPAMLPMKADENISVSDTALSSEAPVPENKPSPLSEKDSDEKSVPENKPSDDISGDKDNTSPEAVRIMGIFSAEGIGGDAVKAIIDLARSSSDKQHFYTGMTKKFGMEEGLRFYKALRPEYSNIRKLSKKAVSSIHN